MGQSFGEKFEQALAVRRETEPQYGLRTLAAQLADGDPRQTEIIRRRLYKYRPPKGGGTAISPTEPTRREIERALGLEVDALRPDEQPAAVSSSLALDLAAMFSSAIDRAVDEKLAQRELVA